MQDKVCRVCHREELRPHRHDRGDIASHVRYGRYAAWEERRWTRLVYQQARRRLEESE